MSEESGAGLVVEHRTKEETLSWFDQTRPGASPNSASSPSISRGVCPYFLFDDWGDGRYTNRIRAFNGCMRPEWVIDLSTWKAENNQFKNVGAPIAPAEAHTTYPSGSCEYGIWYLGFHSYGKKDGVFSFYPIYHNVKEYIRISVNIARRDVNIYRSAGGVETLIGSYDGSGRWASDAWLKYTFFRDKTFKLEIQELWDGKLITYVTGNTDQITSKSVRIKVDSSADPIGFSDLVIVNW
jgi:hypothetical protein